MSWTKPEPLLWVLPGQVETDSGTLTIDTDFRIWAEAERLAADGALKPSALLRLLQRAFSGNAALQDRGEVFLWFLTCGKDPDPFSVPNPGQPVLDYGADRDRIIAAFQREYGIDLLSAHLHWWRFRSLLGQLLTGDDLRTVVEYRCMPLDRVPKEQRRFYAAKKQLYALHHRDTETVEERDRLLAARLKQAAGKEDAHV